MLPEFAADDKTNKRARHAKIFSNLALGNSTHCRQITYLDNLLIGQSSQRMRLALSSMIPTLLSLSVFGIILSGAKKQMFRIYTFANVALVANVYFVNSAVIRDAAIHNGP